MPVIQFYKSPGLSTGATSVKLELLKSLSTNVKGLETESCFNIEVESQFTNEEIQKLKWILGSPYSKKPLQTETFLDKKIGEIIEIGPR